MWPENRRPKTEAWASPHLGARQCKGPQRSLRRELGRRGASGGPGRLSAKERLSQLGQLLPDTKAVGPQVG